MGFFRSLFDEAGKKTGSAIGNKLFPKSTDFIRLGELGVNQEKRLAATQERIEMESQAELIKELFRIQFDTHDLEHNIEQLTQVAAIIDSLPSWIQRTELEQKAYKMAQSKLRTGIEICKSIEPGNPVVKHFENKYK